MTLIYEARDLKKYYGAALALDIPSFSLEKGATLILEGANGSGKSTFLRLLAFLETPSSGELRFYGGPEPRLHCSLMLQEPWLMHASVFHNVTLGLRLRGIRSGLKETFQKAMTAAGFAEPARFAKRGPAALSGGEKQRVALAARLALAPEVLLLDEPTAYVDASSRNHIIEALRSVNQAGTAIVCATHDEKLAEILHADKMKMIRPGE